MDTPLIILYIAISAVVAIILLVAAPAFLLDYGLDIAWAWVSILASWVLIEVLHADFEDEQENSRRAAVARIVSAINGTTAASVSLGDACRQASVDIKRLSAAWERRKTIVLTGIAEYDDEQA